MYNNSIRNCLLTQKGYKRNPGLTKVNAGVTKNIIKKEKMFAKKRNKFWM